MLRQLPNLITALRIVLAVPLGWLIGSGDYRSALVVAALAGFSDALDGFLARRFGWRSWVGGLLDPLADKLLLTVAFVWLSLVGELPPWLAFLVVGRDLVIVGGALAWHFLIGRLVAEPSVLSKLTTVVQILFVLLLLLHLSAWIDIAMPLRRAFELLTAGVTAASGLHYVLSWSLRARRRVLSKEER